MKSFLIIVLASISCANVHSFHVSDDSDVIDNSGRMLLESVGPVLRGEIAAPGPCVGGSCSAPMITAGAGIISASYPVRPRIQYAPAMSYGQVVESKHVKISVREESQILRRGLNFIKIVWGLISLLPKSVIRHGLFIPMKIARFIHVIGSTLLQNIENTIAQKVRGRCSCPADLLVWRPTSEGTMLGFQNTSRQHLSKGRSLQLAACCRTLMQ
ncbi:unnamed protein product [Nesidiocoris tenuis]|uniref:Uncharacterized protein n=1 Tax=Nesidiocoris tenuis TaxID=355587 RepID=A0A6H5HNI6_9HEMI|nr:unnamed protein product [Nesidiocoris tenuis]